MGNITIGEVGAALAFVAGAITSFAAIKAAMSRALSKQIQQELGPVIDGLNAMLAFRLERESERALKRDYITESAREAILKLEKPYLDGGQNGAIRDKCARALALPTVSDEEFERRSREDCNFLAAQKKERKDGK